MDRESSAHLRGVKVPNRGRHLERQSGCLGKREIHILCIGKFDSSGWHQTVYAGLVLNKHGFLYERKWSIGAVLRRASYR